MHYSQTLAGALLCAAALVAPVAAGRFSTCAALGRCYETCADAASCYDIPTVPASIPGGAAAAFLSSNTGLKLDPSLLAFTAAQPSNWTHWQRITVDQTQRFQTLLGFGGAFTDAAAIHLAELSEPVQKLALEAYFGPRGAQYAVGRVPIGGSDFSTHSYSYDGQAGDYALKTFALAPEDTQRGGKLDMIGRAQALNAAIEPARPLSLFASVWSAPPWLKVNASAKDGFIGGNLDPSPRAQQAWADYLSRFISEYASRGVELWGITMQNEPFELPFFLAQTWDSMVYSPAQALAFVRDHLGPTLRRDHPRLKLMIHDDQAPNIMATLAGVLSDPAVREFVDGVAIHWYTIPGHGGDYLTQAHEWLCARNMSNVFLLPTEACTGFNALLSPPHAGPDLGNWERGQTYGLDILNDLNGMAIGWTDWNLLLDLQGGPNHANNFCDAPLLMDPKNATFVFKQPMYYYLAHFSAFLPPGSVRVGVVSEGPVPMEVTAFARPDNRIAMVVLNRDYFFAREFYFHDAKRGYVSVNMPAASVYTFVYDAVAP